MNENLVKDLKAAIKNIKLEIIEKQNQLETLIEQYQELTGIEFDDEPSDNDL